MFDRPVTVTGDVRCVLVPSPRVPKPLSPHPRTVPSLKSVSVKALPAATCVAPAMPATCPGVERLVVLPVPS